MSLLVMRMYKGSFDHSSCRGTFFQVGGITRNLHVPLPCAADWLPYSLHDDVLPLQSALVEKMTVRPLSAFGVRAVELVS